MEAFIANNLDAYGPFAVFLLLMLSGIGISLGEEIVIIPAGALVGHAELGLGPTIVAAYLGVVCSDILWFTLCHRYGTRLLHRRAFKRLVHPRRLLEAKHQMERRGTWMIVMARFVPGSRTTAITVAGILHLPFWKFAIATAGCAVITAPLQVAIGVLSTRVVSVESTAELLQLVVAMVVLVIAALAALRLWRRHRTAQRRLPRAKARWLRRFHMPRLRRGGQAGRSSCSESPSRPPASRLARPRSGQHA
ncbi:MAG: VTT domain-containing protein [Planctomycetota bacterium]|jgi:membrane protein DedA with SNARE-associated domain